MAAITPVNVSSQLLPHSENLSPAAAHEWKVALRGIKLKYLQRKYKQCVAHASRLLDTSTSVRGFFIELAPRNDMADG
jgi:hypothetical protein